MCRHGRMPLALSSVGKKTAETIEFCAGKDVPYFEAVSVQAPSHLPQPPPQPCMLSRPTNLPPARVLQGPNIAQSITTPHPLLRACIHLQRDAVPTVWFTRVLLRLKRHLIDSHRLPVILIRSWCYTMATRLAWRARSHGSVLSMKRAMYFYGVSPSE